MTWDDVRTRLEREVAGLGDDGFVVLSEPAPPAGPPRGLLRRRHQPPSRYVQVRSDPGMLYAECVGATLFDGEWEISATQHEQLRGLGWFVPGEENPWEVEQNYPNYFRYDERSRGPEVAHLCVESLELLGVDPDHLIWRQGP